MDISHHRQDKKVFNIFVKNHNLAEISGLRNATHMQTNDLLCINAAFSYINSVVFVFNIFVSLLDGICIFFI